MVGRCFAGIHFAAFGSSLQFFSADGVTGNTVTEEVSGAYIVDDEGRVAGMVKNLGEGW